MNAFRTVAIRNAVFGHVSAKRKIFVGLNPYFTWLHHLTMSGCAA